MNIVSIKSREIANLEVRRKADLLAKPNDPLGWVILVPPDSIAIVHGKLVVEVVVSLADSDECSKYMVPRRMLIVKRCFAKPVGQRVDTESRL